MLQSTDFHFYFHQKHTVSSFFHFVRRTILIAFVVGKQLWFLTNQWLIFIIRHCSKMDSIQTAQCNWPFVGCDRQSVYRSHRTAASPTDARVSCQIILSNNALVSPSSLEMQSLSISVHLRYMELFTGFGGLGSCSDGAELP